MKNKLFQARMFSMILAFGVLLVGCPDPTNHDITGYLLTTWGSSYYSPKAGETYTVNTTNVGGTGTINVMWFRDNVAITGTTNTTYLLTPDDVGKRISVQVSREGYAGYLSSSTSYPVVASDAPNLTGTVSISGRLEVGQIITVDTSALTGTGDLIYQWVRYNENYTTWINDATSSTYMLANDDLNKVIEVRVVRSGYYGYVFATTSSPIGN
jgi:hypothetical protein